MSQLFIKPYSQRLQEPYRWSKGTHYVRRGLIIKAKINNHVGWGEAALPPQVDYPGWSFATHCQSLLEGLDPNSNDFFEQLALREISPRLRCGISSALFSAQAAAKNQSLAQFIAGKSATPVLKSVPINDLIGTADPKECVAQVRSAVERGQTTIKLKCTHEKELDLNRVKAIRDAFPDITLRLDPNESWELAWALEQIQAMEPFNIDYIEEPLPRGTDLSIYAEICKKTPIPIALDDSIRSYFHAQRALELNAAKVWIIKPPRVGGIDITQQIIQLAQSANIRCIVTASLETAVGLYVGLHAAALLGSQIEACGLGTARFFANDVAPPPPIVNGFMLTPTSAGLGLNPEEWWQQN